MTKRKLIIEVDCLDKLCGGCEHKENKITETENGKYELWCSVFSEVIYRCQRCQQCLDAEPKPEWDLR